jgi:AcrR family transcriptional regulator/DNA-binding XRE family transcriptional regulator
MNGSNETALRAARRRAGLTQTALAEALGVSGATLSRAETGAAALGASRLARAAELLGVPLEDLVGGRPAPAVLLPGVLQGQYVDGGPGSWRVYDELRLAPQLQAALTSFLELGYHGTSVRDLARLAGLSVPGLYYHVASKQALLVAVMDLTMTDFRDRCVAARAEGADAAERFTLLVECFALFHSVRRELAFIGASEMRSLEDDDHRRIADLRTECQHLVTTEVEALAAAGLIDNPYPEDAARAVVTMLVGIANWYRDDGELTPEQIARRYAVHSAALIGLATPGG